MVYVDFVFANLPIWEFCQGLKKPAGKFNNRGPRPPKADGVINMDTIANLLTIIRNGYIAKKPQVTAPHSKFGAKILEILNKQGYIAAIKIESSNNLKKIEIQLKYEGKTPAISGIIKVSKPGRRIYRSGKNIPPTPTGYGITIVSTPAGVMTAQEAKRQNLGGEIICHVW